MRDRLRIATRKSPLALWQAEHVAERLRAERGDLEVELVPMSTEGDKLLDAPLAKVGGKGLFLKELQKALLDHRADIAVHSMKDVPVQQPDELHIPVILARGDPHDAFVCPAWARLEDLPPGARVGTSSLRRRCQLVLLRPDLIVESVRGGVHTRLEKLDRGEIDALVLARVGLARMGLEARIGEYFEPDRMLPAVGQGALGIECRRGDAEIEALIAALHDQRSAQCTAAERAMNRGLGGGCQVPIGGFAEHHGTGLRLRGLVCSLAADEVIREERSAARPEEAEALGLAVANAMLERGAGRILEQIYRCAG